MAQEQLEIEKVESSEEGKDDKEEKVICIAAKCRGPGPAKYLLPGTIGLKGHDIRKQRCPAFSFGQRHKEFSSSFSPGPKYMFPAYATRKGRETAPAFSLHSRTREKANFLTPGPGQYSPEKCHPPQEKRAPCYTFKTRTKYLFQDVTPSPNSYSLPPMIGPKVVSAQSAPAHSLSARSAIGGFSEDLKKTPGPGTYEVTHPNTNRRQMPAYTMNGRNYMPEDTTLKPGPGQHSPEKVVYNKPTAPKFSFGVRHSDYITVPLWTTP
ncbi:PREDICTED: outer dense fiber protein 3-like [Acropora digitifera]|uniref:outer dense fiber protein 3-like n=1 Tax=Acropora digitifera TaxID=70779 RepID=UPI00077A11D2|nr:PREDICTED: outer dense fiber protein 3-like [Acropora digitifera]